MGGAIGVESAPGLGSTFWFTITLAKQPTTAAANENAAAPEPLPPRAADLLAEPPARRILVAEDNAVNQRIIAHQLQKLGYTADVVGDGLEVLEALSRIPYDVILMDCRMPQLDGFETTARIRAQGGHQPYIIAITANAMRGDREICLAAGMDGYVSKPVRTAALETALREQQKRVPARAVDPAMLAQLRSMDEEDAPGIFAELVSLFTESTPNLLQVARSSIEDPHTLSMAAHTMKGSCSHFGALHMQTLCAQLEALDSQAKPGEANALIAAIEEEYAKVRAELVLHHAHA
jgi:CheY-like chemotaxis protein